VLDKVKKLLLGVAPWGDVRPLRRRYEVNVTKSDGSSVEIHLDSSFQAPDA
jgi:hypothetical protein